MRTKFSVRFCVSDKEVDARRQEKLSVTTWFTSKKKNKSCPFQWIILICRTKKEKKTKMRYNRLDLLFKTSLNARQHHICVLFSVQVSTHSSHLFLLLFFSFFFLVHHHHHIHSIHKIYVYCGHWSLFIRVLNENVALFWSDLRFMVKYEMNARHDARVRVDSLILRITNCPSQILVGVCVLCSCHCIHN